MGSVTLNIYKKKNIHTGQSLHHLLIYKHLIKLIQI